MSSSLLSSAPVGEPYWGDPRSRLSGSAMLEAEAEAAEPCAFCRVAGSYHPSARSPRFLTNVSILLMNASS